MTLSNTDRIRLAEAFRLAESVCDLMWPRWSDVSFSLLLVTPDHEFLIRHPRPTDDFILIGYDELLKSNVHVRPRIFDMQLLATFPAVGGMSTIVVGQAENTHVETSTPWVITVLHEYFHQLQATQPNLDAEIAALNLARGDQTGMWMLNYAFPYDAPEVGEQVSLLGRLLADVLQGDNANIAAKCAVYLEARRHLQTLLDADDYNYLSFQLWNEGLARYTEYHVAQLAASRYEASDHFRALPDYMPFATHASQMTADLLHELATLNLANQRRVAFYPLGAGEGLLLDWVNPGWQRRYFVEKFYNEKYFDVSN